MGPVLPAGVVARSCIFTCACGPCLWTMWGGQNMHIYMCLWTLFVDPWLVDPLCGPCGVARTCIFTCVCGPCLWTLGLWTLFVDPVGWPEHAHLHVFVDLVCG